MVPSKNSVAPATATWSSATPIPTGQRRLLACGVIGPLLFNVVYLIEGATRPGYDAWHEAVSALSLSDGGWVQSVNFIVFGLLSACFALGLRRALVPGVAATWAPLLSGVVALGLIVVGIFAQDPTPGYPQGVGVLAAPTAHAVIHLLATVVTLTARAGWCFVMAARFAREPRWRGWAMYAVATGILMMVFLAAFGAAMAQHGPAGLFERLALIVASLLTILIAARLLARTGRVSAES